ncbi:MAG: TetR family transcriptional regulator [Pikeienuella sp.]
MNRKNDALADAETESASGWRGSREIWLGAAKRAFLDSGLEAVKIQPLAAGLNISRASFYWFFRDRAALLEALLEEWEAKNTGAFTAACAAYAETIAEAMLNLISVFHDEARFESQLDFAVRGWAHQSDAVMTRVNREDALRLDAIRALFERFGFAPDKADVRARAIYLVQIGYISMQTREDNAARMARVADYVRIFCGEDPTEGEMARFHAGLQFVPTAPEGGGKP